MTKSRPVSWRLAPGYLAAGKVNLLVGSEGIGKSLWTVQAMASITNAKTWGPFTIETDPSDVILIATEDGWDDTIRPRMEVAGADLDRVQVLCAESDGSGIPQFPKDMETLRDSKVAPSLVVVDAWVDTVEGGLTIKDPQKARQAVAPWKSYAADTGAAVLLVAHTNRQESRDIRNTYGLSGALRQVARSTIYALEDRDSKNLLVGPEKSNLGAKGSAHSFTKTSVQYFPATTESDGTIALLEYLGQCDSTISDILASQVDGFDSKKKTDAIDSWLVAELENGPIGSSELDMKAKIYGYTEDQLRGARKRVGAESRKVGKTWMTGLNSGVVQDGMTG